MARGLLVIAVVITLLSACTQRLICPAYQSSFIYDKQTLKKKFSYFNEDSTPKILTASKSKYLIAVPESYAKKYRRMQTVEMKPVYPVKPDSLKPKDDFSLAEMDVTDSTNRIDSTVVNQAIQPGDSAYAITKAKEKYNLDQDLYMWYFRDVLVLPDVRAAMEKKNEKKDEASGKSGKKEKKGFFSGLKNLFKKKPKTDKTDSLSTGSDKTKTDAQPKKKKKGLFGKGKTEDPVKKDDPPKKKDDGF